MRRVDTRAGPRFLGPALLQDQTASASVRTRRLTEHSGTARFDMSTPAFPLYKKTKPTVDAERLILPGEAPSVGASDLSYRDSGIDDCFRASYTLVRISYRVSIPYPCSPCLFYRGFLLICNPLCTARPVTFCYSSVVSREAALLSRNAACLFSSSYSFDPGSGVRSDASASLASFEKGYLDSWPPLRAGAAASRSLNCSS